MLEKSEYTNNDRGRLRNIEQTLIRLIEQISTENQLREQENRAREEWRTNISEQLTKLMELFIRVDRLEQERKRTEKIEGLAWASGIGLLFKVVWDMVVGHLK